MPDGRFSSCWPPWAWCWSSRARTSQISCWRTLKSARGSDRLRHGLCVAQVALGLVLVSGAGLLIGSFLHLVRRDLGFRPEGLLTFSINLPDKGYAGPKQLDFHARLLDQLRSLPGVT